MDTSRDWKKRIIATLLRVEQEWSLDPLPDSAPMWKANLAEKLLSSASLASKVDSRSFSHLTAPRKLGGFVGVKKASSDAISTHIRKRRTEVLKRGFTLRDRMLFAFFGAEESEILNIWEWYLHEQRQREQAAVRRCLAIAADETGPQSIEFFGGFHDAVRTYVFDLRGTSYGETSASPIYRILFTWGERCQERLHSLAELHTFLRSILGSQAVGDVARLKKICERIEFTIAPPGRPKRKRDIQEIQASLFPEVKAIKARLDEDIIASKTVRAKAGLLQTRSRRGDRSKRGHH